MAKLKNATLQAVSTSDIRTSLGILDVRIRGFINHKRMAVLCARFNKER